MKFTFKEKALRVGHDLFSLVRLNRMPFMISKLSGVYLTRISIQFYKFLQIKKYVKTPGQRRHYNCDVHPVIPM